MIYFKHICITFLYMVYLLAGITVAAFALGFMFSNNWMATILLFLISVVWAAAIIPVTHIYHKTAKKLENKFNQN